MMIDPEMYYEELKGKSVSEIEASIVELKDSIEKNKSLLENFKPGVDEVCFPHPSTQIIFIKSYLEVAKQALHEAGGKYKPTKAEKRAMKIDENIPDLKKLVLKISGNSSKYKKIKIYFGKKRIKIQKEKIGAEEVEEMKVEYPTNKEYFMKRLQDIHFGEWKPEYHSDYMMDGTEWKLKLRFEDEKKLKFYGSNSYPYNFDDLKDLINELIGEPLL